MGRLGAMFVILTACGGGSSTVDAPTRDAHPDSPPACANMTCGTTCCATAAYECTPACTCPSGIVPTPFTTIIEQMDTTRQAPAVLGIGVFSGTDNKLHALVIGFDPVNTPVGSDITLPTSPIGGAPFVGLGYDINVSSQTTRAAFFASQGTLNLTRRCAAGVAGSITGVVVREQTSTTDPTPAAMGCTITVPDLTFDYAGSCI